MTSKVLSIVIVSYNIENYIEQALRSCLHDSIEIIVVDNASTDSTVELVYRLSSTVNHAIKVVQNTENLGPGIARNIGMGLATGRYLTFLDGDDWYRTENLLKAINVMEEHRPDVLLFNHARAWNTGWFSKNQNSPRLYERNASGVDERRKIMSNFSVVWNKIYKLDFIKSNKLLFSSGIYEDISFSFLSQMKAKKIYVLPDILVNYRQRSGSITKSKGREHLNIFNEYDVIYNELKESATLRKNYGQEIYRYARTQMIHVLTTGSRLNASDERDYIRLCVQNIDKWKKLLNIKHTDIFTAVMRTNSPFAVSVYRRLREFIHSRNPLVKGLKAYSRRLVRNNYRRTYKLFALLPIKKNKVFFESYWGAKADCNPLAIANELYKRGGYEIVWSMSPNAKLPSQFPFKVVERNSLSMLFHAATSKYLISNTNISGDIVKRPGTVHVQTWHGTPLKVMGIDIRPFNPKEMRWSAFAARCMRWDFVLSSNPHSSSAWRSACPYNYKVLETGYPRNDILINGELDIAALRSKLGIPEGKKIALYAPTVRDVSKGKKLNLWELMIEPDRIAAALGDEYVLLVRSHYFLKGTSDQYYNIIDVSDYPISNEICLISDLLITDYSSIMFDYACLKRPIVLHIPDYDDYSRERGVYFDIRKTPPGAISYDGDELCEILSKRIFESKENSARLSRFNSLYCPWDDGKAAARVVDLLMSK